MAFQVLSVQETPNPNALKFVLDRPCSEGTVSFLHAQQATGHPLAERLFAIPGVCSVLLLGDFVTVNKQPEFAWNAIRRAVEAVLTTN